jgi:hypothetical protein
MLIGSSQERGQLCVRCVRAMASYHLDTKRTHQPDTRDPER